MFDGWLCLRRRRRLSPTLIRYDALQPKKETKKRGPLDIFRMSTGGDDQKKKKATLTTTNKKTNPLLPFRKTSKFVPNSTFTSTIVSNCKKRKNLFDCFSSGLVGRGASPQGVRLWLSFRGALPCCMLPVFPWTWFRAKCKAAACVINTKIVASAGGFFGSELLLFFLEGLRPGWPPSPFVFHASLCCFQARGLAPRVGCGLG